MAHPKPTLLGDGQALTVHNGKVSSVIDGIPTILAIMDEFSSTALSADANLLQPTPKNWQTLLDQHQVDLLIVESAWVGNNGSWHRKVGWYSEDEITDLEALVNACRERNIPSLFYNKEDPVHFNRFSKTSALFDSRVHDRCRMYSTLRSTREFVDSVRGFNPVRRSTRCASSL